MPCASMVRPASSARAPAKCKRKKPAIAGFFVFLFRVALSGGCVTLLFRSAQLAPTFCLKPNELVVFWCRRDESNTRPSHYEFSPADKAKKYWKHSERKLLSLLKFPHSAVEAVTTQPPAKRAISVPELCHADRRAEPAKSRGPPVLPATRDKTQHSRFACFGVVERDIRLISPRQIFRLLAH